MKTSEYIKCIMDEIESVKVDLRLRITAIGQVKCSKILGIPQPNLSQFINGKKNYSLKKLKQIAEELEKNI